MTNTKFRKRALLSSVAMLLVALVALGSATFAWFTANPNADATGIKMRTTAAAGLVVRTETDEDWTHNAKLRKTDDATSAFNATPVSQDQSTLGFWTVLAASAGQYNASTEATDVMSSVPDNDSAFYSEKIYCKLSDGSDASTAASKKVYIKGVSITPSNNTNASMSGAMRVAIVGPTGENGADKLLGTWALSTTGANGTLTTASKTAGSFSPALATTSTNLDVNTGLTGLSADGGDLTKYITVYVYLDGQDSDCYSEKVGTVNAAEIISGVDVDLILK